MRYGNEGEGYRRRGEGIESCLDRMNRGGGDY